MIIFKSVLIFDYSKSVFSKPIVPNHLFPYFFSFISALISLSLSLAFILLFIPFFSFVSTLIPRSLVFIVSIRGLSFYGGEQPSVYFKQSHDYVLFYIHCYWCLFECIGNLQFPNTFERWRVFTRTNIHILSTHSYMYSRRKKKPTNKHTHEKKVDWKTHIQECIWSLYRTGTIYY